MGWLFGRKKKPKVPLPEGTPMDEKSLQMPRRPGSTVIEPQKVKEAAGVGKAPSPPPKKEQAAPEAPTVPSAAELPSQPMYVPSQPLYVKVDVYQRLLGELDDLKGEISHLSEYNVALMNSELKEEGNFDKLRRTMKVAHDRMAQVDKVIFKG